MCLGVDTVRADIADVVMHCCGGPGEAALLGHVAWVRTRLTAMGEGIKRALSPRGDGVLQAVWAFLMALSRGSEGVERKTQQ